MYNPPAFREDRVDVLCDAIRSHPLGMLITAGPSGLLANVAPFLLREEAGQQTLTLHLAKANPQLADMRAGGEVLVVFQGPQGYISPGWYPTKQEHGKAVPTWNYVIVQARGTPRVIDDPAWVLAQVTELTADHERGRADPWAPTDAPATYIQSQLKGIVGVEIPAVRLEGKWKMSQNQPPQNKAGVVEALRGDGMTVLADVVEQRAKAAD